MADIRAFRAFRYDLGRVGALADVVAPPYDVIDPALQKRLYDQSPYNVIRLILNKEEAGDNENTNRYTRAGRFLKDWTQDGILVQDSARSLYVYHQDFEVEGQRFTRKGFLARVRLEKFGQGKIYPHEETMSGPKADRLKLFHATGMNLSPVFGLYPDAEGAVQAELDRAVGRGLALEARDHLGVTSKLWPVSDQHATSAVTGLMGPKPIFIADGHHRYETGLRYLDDKTQAGEVRDAEAPANFILMMLVSMSDPGLAILPTHRLVSGLGDLTADQVQAALDGYFQVEKVGQGAQAARDAWELIAADGGQKLLGFGTVADGQWLLARYVGPDSVMAELAARHSPAWHGLGVSLLHILVLGKLLRGQPECRYVHLTSEVIDAVSRRECQVAVLVPPASMRHVEEIAGNLEKMPPKSTYFYPKLLSGLLFNSLRVH
jgi:uncharacterized protein (DUF1015 family)